MSEQLTFVTKLEIDKDGTWWYVHVPKKIRDAFKQHEKRGIVHVTATIGKTTWEGSMLPWADGSAQISVGKNIRDKESLKLGDAVSVSVLPR